MKVPASRFKGSLASVVCAVLVICVPYAASAATPSIKIASVPPYAVDGFIHGKVTGVDFTTHQVAPYIQIEGLGWWTKPTFANPTVPINPDGTFRADVATGGIDNRATIYFVALIPADVTPPIADGDPRVPKSLWGIALAADVVERYARTLEFAGRTWAVKEAPVPVGPGPNRFSFEEEDVFVDAEGNLHLTIKFHDGFWWSTEVILLDRLGFGSYSFKTVSRLDVLDVNATFAGFMWDPFGDEKTVPGSPSREFDVEDSRWGNPNDPTNAQFVVQPFRVPGNLCRYTIPALTKDPALTRFFTWKPCLIRFVALQGHHCPFDFPAESLIHEFIYTHDPDSNHFVPTEGRAAFRFNLWLNNPAAGPADGRPIEVVITDFSFFRSDPSCPADVNADCAVNVLDLLALLAAWGSDPGGPPDLDGDGIVGILDLLTLLANWGNCP